MELSVVIPCLNEAKTIGECVAEARAILARTGIAGEVVVADNGSSDNSPEIAELAGARVVKVAERGYGSAIKGGVEAARSEFVFIADGDGQHDFEDIPRFLERLRSGYDLVVGNRFAGGSDRRSMSWSHRYIGNPLLSGLLRGLFHPEVHDSQCGMRAVTRRAFLAMDLRTSGFEFSPEMVVKATHHHLRVAELPTTIRPDRRDRKPHLRTVPDGWRHLVFILMCAPRTLFIVPGLTMFIFGTFVVSWLAVGPQQVGPTGLNTRAQLFGILVASFGVQLASVGLFARVFTYSEPFRARRRSLTTFFKALKLEQGLACAAVLIVAGMIGDARFLVPWAVSGFHVLQGVRWIVFWSFWLLLGFQVSISSVFLSMIGISRGIWIGRSTVDSDP